MKELMITSGRRAGLRSGLLSMLAASFSLNSVATKHIPTTVKITRKSRKRFKQPRASQKTFNGKKTYSFVRKTSMLFASNEMQGVFRCRQTGKLEVLTYKLVGRTYNTRVL